ncbi:MAG: fibronectin type III domain-containing protein, partial [Bacillota bacterium]
MSISTLFWARSSFHSRQRSQCAAASARARMPIATGCVSRWIELLESRQLLAAFPAEVHINFQPPGTPAPSGYFVDSGKPMGNRGNGLVYGWNQSNYTYQQRNSPLSPDVRYDTFVGMDSTSLAWFIQVPNGLYQVHVVAGDPSYAGSVLRVNVKGTTVIAATTTASKPWAETTVTVSVSNYLLRISGAPGSQHNTLDFVDIVPIVNRPDAPPAVTATAASDRSIELAWVVPAGPISSYLLERSTDGVNWSAVVSLPRDVTHYTDNGLTEGTPYSYRVRAINAKGGSDPVIATATTLLAAPTSLQAKSFANVPHIALSWTDNSTHATGYIIERSADGASFAEIARVGPDATTYDDIPLTAGTTYTYRVRPYGPAQGLAATAAAQTTDFRVFENTYFTN